jgi:hypothetical protein
MESNLSKAQVSFAKLLRAYQTGGICFDELIDRLDQHLLEGAIRSELLDTLRRRESVEPLADSVYLAVWSRLRRVTETPNAAASGERIPH